MTLRWLVLKAVPRQEGEESDGTQRALCNHTYALTHGHHRDARRDARVSFTASRESAAARRPGATGSEVLSPTHASRGPTIDSGSLLAPMDCHCTASYLTLMTAWGAPWPLQVNYVLHRLAYEDDMTIN